MKNLFTLDALSELESKGLLSFTTYQLGYIETSKKLADNVNEFYACQVLVRLSEYDNKFHFEHSDVYLIDPELTLRVAEYKGKHEIHCLNHWNLKNLSMEQKREIEKKFPEPNKIGVFTTNKIVAWIEYNRKVYDEMLRQETDIILKINAFRQRITEPELIKNAKVWNDSDRKRGTITKNGIRLEWSIYDGGYISTKLEIVTNYNDDNITAFMNISNNSFIR